MKYNVKNLPILCHSLSQIPNFLIWTLSAFFNTIQRRIYSELFFTMRNTWKLNRKHGTINYNRVTAKRIFNFTMLVLSVKLSIWDIYQTYIRIHQKYMCSFPKQENKIFRFNNFNSNVCNFSICAIVMLRRTAIFVTDSTLCKIVTLRSLPKGNSDPRWYGAWWIGFIIAMVMALLASIPMLAFARELPGDF